METFLRDHINMPAPYIYTVASVFRERFAWREMHTPRISSSSTDQSTAVLSLAEHAARHILREHMDGMNASDLAKIVEVDALRTSLVQFSKQDPIFNMMRVLRSIPLCSSPFHFAGTKRVLNITSLFALGVREAMTLNSTAPVRIEFNESFFKDEYTFTRYIHISIELYDYESYGDTKKVAGELGFSTHWDLVKNEEMNIAKTIEFFRRIHMTEKMIRWFRVRI
eukprot:6172847-Pleurochrysis_carterae.AAC.1